MGDRVQEILSWYGSDNVGTKTNIARLLRSGKLAGPGQTGQGGEGSTGWLMAEPVK